MPQFHLDNFVPQLVWLAIFFMVLYFGIVRLTLPKLGRAMTAREDKIAGDLSTAERAKADADAMAAQYEAGLADAHASARTAIATARSGAAASIDKAVAAGNIVIAEKALAADASLMAARIKALGEVEGVAADAGADIVERLTGTRPARALVADVAKTVMAA